MSTSPAGIAEADWLSWPARARAFIVSQQQEIQSLRQENGGLRAQLATLAIAFVMVGALIRLDGLG